MTGIGGRSIIGIIVFMAGLLIGSFINVCLYRIPRKQSIVSPGSACPSCGTRLKPADLVPVFSYIFLKGKCRYCKAKISPRYPLVELATGVVFLVVYVIIGIFVE